MVSKVSIVNKSFLVSDLIFLNELLNFGLIHADVQCAKACSEASFTNGSFSKTIEVMEEFLDADLSFEDFSLHALFNV